MGAVRSRTSSNTRRAENRQRQKATATREGAKERERESASERGRKRGPSDRGHTSAKRLCESLREFFGEILGEFFSWVWFGRNT